MISWVRDAEAQVQQRIPPTDNETRPQEGPVQEGRDDGRGSVSAEARNGLCPVLWDLREESKVQGGHTWLEDMHSMP